MKIKSIYHNIASARPTTGALRAHYLHYYSIALPGHSDAALQHPEALVLPHLAVLLRDLKLLYHRLAIIRQVALERHII